MSSFGALLVNLQGLGLVIEALPGPIDFELAPAGHNRVLDLYALAEVFLLLALARQQVALQPRPFLWGFRFRCRCRVEWWGVGVGLGFRV